MVEDQMSGERKRVIIRRRPVEGQEEQEPSAPLDPSQLRGTVLEPQPQEQPQTEQTTDVELEAALRRAREVYDEAVQRYNEFVSRLERLRERDRSVQSAYMKSEEVFRLAVVKRKLDELNAERSALLTAAGPVEQRLTQAIADLESVVSDLEQMLFDRLVDLEELNAMRGSGVAVNDSDVRIVEEECNRIRSEIARTRSRIDELRKKVEVLRSLPRTIYKITTHSELAEEYYRQLKSQRNIDEAKLEEHVKKIMQEEQVPWEYAVLYLYKRLMKRVERPQ
ncbi:MAG: hypothetical protein QXP81_00440 [Nitrososphaerota archaeon]|nr:hypothetical protein [Candidatus Calditenuis fumarioli]